jgi:hypothetical protein
LRTPWGKDIDSSYAIKDLLLINIGEQEIYLWFKRRIRAGKRDWIFNENVA